MAKALAKNKGQAVATINDSIFLEDAANGQDGMGRDDLMIPRLSILQQMSAQVSKRDGAYVEGAEPGYILDTVDQKATDGEEGIVVVPIIYRRAHIEWKPDRGGFVADHGKDSSCLERCTRGAKGEYLTDEGNEIVPTGEYFVFVVDADGFSPAMLSMAKSQLKKARQWNMMISRLMINAGSTRINPAMFWTAYQLTTVPEENDQGAWFGWSVKMLHDAASGGIIDNHSQGKEIYLAARDFKSQLSTGDVRISPESDVM